jgi:hypothetical protein
MYKLLHFCAHYQCWVQHNGAALLLGCVHRCAEDWRLNGNAGSVCALLDALNRGILVLQAHCVCLGSW